MTRRSNSGRLESPPRLRRGGERIAAAFELRRDEGRAALMPYMMAGYPDRETSLAVAAAYADSGADLIELGVPFSDPLADGPTIHAAATAALRGGGDVRDRARGLRSVSERVPVVLMAYANMVLAHGGAAEFARLARRRPGRPARSSPTCRWARPRRCARRSPPRGWRWCRWWRRRRPPERRPRICAVARGFVYVVSTVGTTGERAEVPAGAGRAGRRRPRPTRETPVAVGFGIGTAAQAAEVGRIADGVIIGSRLVRAAGEGGSAQARGRAVAEFLAETRVALAG